MPGFDTEIPSPARIYNYLAGGRDNFAADRQLAQRLIDMIPDVRGMVRENRAFLTAAVRWTAARGVGQFIDLGSGLPAFPAIHDAAKAGNPDTRVVAYVDNDPVVVNHLAATVAKDPVVTVIDSDLQDAERILAAPPFDPGTPACLVFGCVLHFLPPDIAAALVRRYVAALASGSYLVVSIAMPDKEKVGRVQRTYNSQGSLEGHRYTEKQVTAFFDGLDLVEPGMVEARAWESRAVTPGTPAARPGISILAAVARKPLGDGPATR